MSVVLDQRLKTNQFPSPPRRNRMVLTAYYIPILFLIAVLILLLIVNIFFMFFGVKAISINVFRETKIKKEKRPTIRESEIE